MPDIWCSFNAFVDYDVYFDENIGDSDILEKPMRT